LILNYLEKSYGITEPGKPSKGSQMGLIQRGVVPPPFNDKKYKKDLINTIITNDLSFAVVEDA